MSRDFTERITSAMRTVIAAAVLTNERIARGFGLNVVDLQTFGMLSTADHPLTAGEISTRTGLPTSTTTRVIDRLEMGGFVVRAPDRADRRKIIVQVLPERLAEVEASYEEIMVGMLRLHEEFTSAELETVARYLERMAQAPPPTTPATINS